MDIRELVRPEVNKSAPLDPGCMLTAYMISSRRSIGLLVYSEAFEFAAPPDLIQ